MKSNWKRKPWMATLSVLLLGCPGMALSKETQLQLEKALKASETELRTLHQARSKERKKTETQTARTNPELATEAR